MGYVFKIFLLLAFCKSFSGLRVKDGASMSKKVKEMRTKRAATVSMISQRSYQCQENPKRCCDQTKYCKFLAKRGQCYRDKRMIENCPETCEFCNPFSAPNCTRTQFGCCWDKRTTKVDFRGSNCPYCKDDYRYVCRAFLYACREFSIAGKFMLQHCKRTCRFCNKGCKDDLRMGYHCSFWANSLNWCSTKKKMMNHFCPSTCGFC